MKMKGGFNRRNLFTDLHYITLSFLQVLLITYGYYYFWEWSIQIAKYYGINHENEILLSAIFVFIIGVFSCITHLPIAIYHTFVLEQKHGFNKQVRFSI